jgi:hypothetical protein
VNENIAPDFHYSVRSQGPHAGRSPSGGSAREWLDRAQQARKAAEKLTDPDAREVVLQLAQLYFQKALIDFTANGVTT